MTDDDRSAFAPPMPSDIVLAGARVYGLGDAPDGLWSVVEGEVPLVSYPESVGMIVGQGAWFGELSVVDARMIALSYGKIAVREAQALRAIGQ
ncbi:MAG: hypothetical protein U1A07_06540 [Phenylobacterium sp.]|nr:hypothetical protein [Phenylobacterium sp.]